MEGVCFGFRTPPDGEAHVRCSRSQLTKRRSELLHAGCAQHFFLHLCWRCTDLVCRRELSIAYRLIPGAQCAGLTAALSGLECPEDWGKPTCAGHFRFLVSFRCKPNCGDQAPILCMSAYSQKLAYAFAYQGGRQRSGRRSIWSGRSSTAGSGVSQPSAAVFRQNKNTPGFLFPGVFFIGDCEKLSWYRCSLSQAGCCRHR